MTESGDDLPIVNFEKLSEAVSMFKFPLILATVGIGLAIFSLILMNKGEASENGIVFSDEASGSASISIHVDIEGSVVNPGVYEFKDGDRVSDGILRAGGLTAEADSYWIEKNLNKAAKLTDGGKIYIPSFSPVEAKAMEGREAISNKQNTLGVTTGLVNINSASQSELEALSGVGPVTAIKIIEGRPYQTVEELKAKKIVGNALYDKIKDKLTI